MLPGDIFEKPGAAFARKIYGWLTSGAAPRPVVVKPPAELPPQNAAAVVLDATREIREAVLASTEPTQLADALDDAFAAYLKAISDAVDLAALDQAAQGPGRPAKGTPNYDWAIRRYKERKAALTAASGAA
jgi:hypothetical protein